MTLRALVTGHMGFVGRHLQPELERRGYDVTGVDLRMGGDVRPWFAADRSRPYDLVVHLAAIVGGRATIEGSPLSVAVDLSIDAEMFGWAIRQRPKRVVYFSSSAAYPTQLQGRFVQKKLVESMIDLDDVRSPDLTYGWAKLTGEQLARYARQAGVPVTVLRPFSGYGSDQDLDYPFPSFIDRAARRADPFDIWGDGTQTRDWVHIDDVIGMTLACVDGEYDGPLNIGWGIPIPFMQLAVMVCAEAGYSPEFRFRPDAPTGVQYRVADPRQMLTVYQPRVTLAEGIARALKEMT